MKLVVNAYARSGAESADRIEKTAGKLRSAAAMVFVAGSGFFRSGVCGEVFDIPTVDAGGGAVPSFIAAVLPAETDSEIAVLKIDGDGRLADGAAQCIHWDADCFELCVLLNEKNARNPNPHGSGALIFRQGAADSGGLRFFVTAASESPLKKAGRNEAGMFAAARTGKRMFWTSEGKGCSLFMPRAAADAKIRKPKRPCSVLNAAVDVKSLLL